MDILSNAKPEWLEALNPPVGYLRVRHTESYTRTDQGKKSSRRIFAYVPYTDYEMDLLAQFHQELQSQGQIMPDWWTNSDSLKMIYHAKHDPLKAVESFKEHVAWKENPQRSVQPAEVSQLVNSTFLFTLGQDKQYRPVVYVRLQVMKNKSTFGLDESISYENIDKAVDWYLCLVRQACFKPYHIENWVMFLDCQGLSIFSFPVKFFTQLMKIMQLNHAATMHKMFIVNTPTGFGSIFSAAKAFMSPDTIEKIQVLSKPEFSQIYAVIDKCQLLEDYDGTLRKPSTLWPPTNLSKSGTSVSVQADPINPDPSVSNPILYDSSNNFGLVHPLKSRTCPSDSPERKIVSPSGNDVQETPGGDLTSNALVPSPDDRNSLLHGVKSENVRIDLIDKTGNTKHQSNNSQSLESAANVPNRSSPTYNARDGGLNHPLEDFEASKHIDNSVNTNRTSPERAPIQRVQAIMTPLDPLLGSHPSQVLESSRSGAAGKRPRPVHEEERERARLDNISWRGKPSDSWCTRCCQKCELI